jgi:hypothetical protein
LGRTVGIKHEGKLRAVMKAREASKILTTNGLLERKLGKIQKTLNQKKRHRNQRHEG